VVRVGTLCDFVLISLLCMVIFELCVCVRELSSWSVYTVYVVLVLFVVYVCVSVCFVCVYEVFVCVLL